MKKLLKATLLLAALTVYTSCSDDNDLKDPSERLSEAMAQYTDALTSAPNGWAVTMYGDLDFGGFNLLCKFEKDGTVTVANERFAADTTAVTHYKLEQSSGVVLSFDEYCELFHYFADPLNTDGFNSQTENGFGGDLEFRIISASADSVVMRGKKHNAKIKMTPLTADTTTPMTTIWTNYLNDVAKVAKAMQKGSYHMIQGTDTLQLKANRTNRVFTYLEEDSVGNRMKKTASYIITPKGITFYEPFIFGDKVVKGFNYADGSEKYEQDGNYGITLEKFTPALNQQLVDGAWFISEDGLGSIAKNYWRTFRNSLVNNVNCYIYYAGIGTWRNHFGLSVGPIDKDDPSGIFTSEAYFDYEFIGSNQIRMWFNGEYDEIGNGEYFAETCDFAWAIFPFGGRDKKSAKTFTLNTDNIKDPSYIKLTDTSNKNNVITVYEKQVTFPFGDKIN